MSAILFIIAVNSVLGLAAGGLMYRSDFCVAGMFRDLFLFGTTRMLRSLLLLIVASMAFFEIIRRAGFLPLYPFPLLASPSLANIAGGLVFGVGMVLAGGCVVGTLYKMGGGNILGATAFTGLLIGSAIYAEIHPWWAGIIKRFMFFHGSITLPQAVGCDPALLILPIIALSAFFFYRWHTRHLWTIASQAAGHIQPWKAAVGLAILGSLSYALVGMPFGITTAYAKGAAFLTHIFAPHHVSQLAFYQSVPLEYPAPISGISLRGGAGPAVDAIAYIQFPLIIGIVAGAMFASLRLREFKVYYNVPPRQYMSALLGGTLLALGSRMTPGCNVWHLFGGIPILNMQSLLFLLGIVPGSYFGSRILVNIVLSQQKRGSP